MHKTIFGALFMLALSLLMTNCSDNPASSPESNTATDGGILSKPPQQPPGNANPAIAFVSPYQVKRNLTVSAIYVMDANGANTTKVYARYTPSSSDYVDFPTWSSDATKLCVNVNGKDLYRMNIGLVNGYPVTSNDVKIADGVADGGEYCKGVWNPAPNAQEIAVVWRPTSGSQALRMVPISGSPKSTLYTSPSTDYIINDDIAFSPDGLKLAFTELQQSTGYNFLKIIERSTGTVVKTVDLSQYYRITGLTWGKSPGSTMVAITVIPTLCGKEKDNLFSIDISAATPVPALLLSGYGAQDVSFAPGDQSFAFVCLAMWGQQANGCWFGHAKSAVYTLNPPGLTYPFTGFGSNFDWKR